MSDAEIIQGLTELFRDLFQRPDLVPVASMQTGDLDGWDSFRNVELLIACETRWHIRFSSREIDGVRTLGDLVAAIAIKLA